MTVYSEESISIIVMIALLIFYLIMMGIAIASYVMNSISLYTIADRRKIKNAWLAWIPIGNYWIIGSIADDYDARNGIKRKWRVLLLTLALIYIVGFLISYAFLIVFTFSTALSSNSSDISPAFGFFILFFYLYIVIIMVGAITLSTFAMICMYKLFESTVPKKAVKYMLIYMLVPIAGSICLLKCKNKGYSNSENNPSPLIPDTETVTEETISADIVENQD